MHCREGIRVGLEQQTQELRKKDSKRQEQPHGQEAIKSKSPACFMADLSQLSTRLSTDNSARFGTLSHHSFFSRHNPHPHRVRHISGLNGSPVCIVNDDWYSNSPLFPHPLIRSQVASSNMHTSLSLPYHLADSARQEAALISEAWREELKDLATKVSLLAGPSKVNEEVVIEKEPMRRKTQYSSATGRIIPPSSCRAKRYDSKTPHTRQGTYKPQASLTYPATHSLEGQELRVLELLCQILQTDSLSTVQQWLLLARDQEKELVLGMIQQAIADSPNLGQQSEFPIRAQTEPPIQTRRKRRMKSLSSAPGTIKENSIKEKPERIGKAEVLRIQPDDNQRVYDSKSLSVHSH